MKFENNSGSSTLNIPDAPGAVPHLRIEDSAGSHVFTFASPLQITAVIVHLNALLGRETESAKVPTSEDIIQNMYRENADNLRWWKEGYADGYPAGFEAGREYQLEQ